ncbi:hypothetical protein AB0D11_47980 [Streptomyces monashensis]|uniref:hypothetical protein n=1 Tax=Streptomyces monashensis TaxID=1678012 RepID=UPI0033FEF7CB
MSDPAQNPDGGPLSGPLTALSEVGLLALGLADLAIDQLRQITNHGQQNAQRSDLPHLLTDGMKELHARGELAARRVAQDSHNHLDLIARKAAARRSAACDE